MSERNDIAVTTARGAVITVLGNATALIIGAAGVLLLARLLSPAEYGQYTIALIPSSFFLLFIDWGINSALPRFLVQRRTGHEGDALRVLVWGGLVIKWLIGTGLAVIVVLLAEPIATQVLNRPDARILIQASALVVIGQPLYQTTFAIFAGYERMGYRSTLSVIHAIIKAGISTFLVIIGLGVAGAIGGHVMSALVTAALGVGFIWQIAGPPYSFQHLRTLWAPTVQMIRFGLPLFAGGLVASIVNQVRLILLPWFVSDVVIGNFQVANYFTMLIFSFTAALGVTLYPTFSKFSYTRDPDGTRQVYRMAVRYSTLLVISVTLLLISVAVPMIETLYGSRYPDAPGFFILLALPGLLSGFGLYAFPAWLNSQGATRCVFVIHVLQAGISLLLAPLGLMVFGMSGFLASLIVSNSVATLYAVMTLHRRYGVPRIFSHTVQVFTIAGLAALASYGLLWALSGFTPVIRLIAGTILYCVLILILAPVTRAIESRDVQALTTMFGRQRVIGPVVRLILGWEATLLHWLKR